ncbi:unnamed protein product [Brassicogethes aeneus]|uniref:Uncharacterized protein n=1 Tax=Brassicogethes aeneus TaxID=1431903 RepID=A0A9P0FDZ0_BRAAE|nr:unnamed protein product [Brassicogethes aeneus]
MGICFFLKISVVLLSVCPALNQEEDFLGLFQPNPSFPHELNEFYATIQNYKDDFKEIRELDKRKYRSTYDEDYDSLNNYKFKREFSLDSHPGNDIYPYMYSNKNDNPRTFMSPEENIRYRRHLPYGILINDNGKSGESNSIESKYPERFRNQQRFVRQKFKKPTYEMVNYQSSDSKRPIYINQEDEPLMDKFVENPKPVMVKILHENDETNEANQQIVRDAPQSNDLSNNNESSNANEEETEDPTLLNKLLDTNAKETDIQSVRFVDKAPLVNSYSSYSEGQNASYIEPNPSVNLNELAAKGPDGLIEEKSGLKGGNFKTIAIMTAPNKNNMLKKPLHKDFSKSNIKNDSKVYINEPPKNVHHALYPSVNQSFIDSNIDSNVNIKSEEEQNDVEENEQQKTLLENQNAPNSLTYSDMSNYWTNMEKQQIHKGIEKAQGQDSEDKAKVIAMALDIKQVHEQSTEMREKGFEAMQSITLPSLRDIKDRDEEIVGEEKRSIFKEDMPSYNGKNNGEDTNRSPVFSSIILEPRAQESMYQGNAEFNDYRNAKMSGVNRYLNKKNEIVYEDDPESKLIKRILGDKSKTNPDFGTNYEGTPIPFVNFPSIVFSPNHIQAPSTVNESTVQSDLIQRTLQEVLPYKMKSLQPIYTNDSKYINSFLRQQKRGIPPRILKSHGHYPKQSIEEEEDSEQEPYSKSDLEALKAKLIRYKANGLNSKRRESRLQRFKREITPDNDYKCHLMRKLQSLEQKDSTSLSEDSETTDAALAMPKLDDLEYKSENKFFETENLIPPRILRTHGHMLHMHRKEKEQSIEAILKGIQTKTPSHIALPKETNHKEEPYGKTDLEEPYSNSDSEPFSEKNPSELYGGVKPKISDLRLEREITSKRDNKCNFMCGLRSLEQKTTMKPEIDVHRVHEQSMEMREKGFEAMQSNTLPSLRDIHDYDEDVVEEEKRSIFKEDMPSYNGKDTNRSPVFSNIVLKPKAQESMYRENAGFNEYKIAKMSGVNRYLNKKNKIVCEDDPESKLIKRILGKKSKTNSNFPSIVFSPNHIQSPSTVNESTVQSDLIQRTLQEVLPYKLKSLQPIYTNDSKYINSFLRQQKRGILPRILKSHGHYPKQSIEEEDTEQEPYSKSDLEALKAKLMRYKANGLISKRRAARLQRFKRKIPPDDYKCHLMRKLQSLEQMDSTSISEDRNTTDLALAMPKLDDLEYKSENKFFETENLIPPRILRTHGHMLHMNRNEKEQSIQAILKGIQTKPPSHIALPKETNHKEEPYGKTDLEEPYSNSDSEPFSEKNPSELYGGVKPKISDLRLRSVEQKNENSTSVPAIKSKRNVRNSSTSTTLNPEIDDSSFDDDVEFNPAKIFFQSKHVIPPRILRTHGHVWQSKVSEKENNMEALLNDISEARKLIKHNDDKEPRVKKRATIPKPKRDESKEAVNNDNSEFTYDDDENQNSVISKKAARAEGDYGDEEDSTKEKMNNVKALKKTKNKFSSPSIPMDSLEDYLNEDINDSFKKPANALNQENINVQEPSDMNILEGINVPFKKPANLQQQVNVKMEGEINAPSDIRTLQEQPEFSHHRPKLFKEKFKKSTEKPNYPHPIITNKFKDYVFKLNGENPLATTEVWKHFQREIASEREDSDFKHWPKYVVDDMNKREQIKKRSLTSKIAAADEQPIDYFIRQEREEKVNITTTPALTTTFEVSTNLYGCKTVNLSQFSPTDNDSLASTTPTTTVNNLATMIPIGDEDDDEQTTTAEDATEIDVFDDFLNGDLSSNILRTVKDNVDNKLTLRKKYHIGPVIHSFNGLCTTQKSEDNKHSRQPQEIILAKKLLDSVSKILNAYLTNFNLQTVITQPKCLELSVNLKDFLNNLITVPKCDNPMEKTMEMEEMDTEEPNASPFLFKMQNKEVLMEQNKQEEVNKKTAVLKQLLSKYEKLPEKCKIRAKPVKEFIIKHLRLLKNVNKPVRSFNEPLDQPVSFSAESVDEILTENSLMQDPVEQQLESVGLGRKREDFQPNFDLKDIIESRTNLAHPAAAPVAKREASIPTKRFLKLYDAVKHLRQRRESEDKIGELYAGKAQKDSRDKLSNVNFESPLVYSL